MKRSQSGISMMGFLFFLIFAGFVAWIGMKIFPMYREYWAIQSAFKGVGSDTANNPAAVRTSLEKRFDVGYVDTELAKLVKFDNSKNSIVLDYERESALVGPFSLKGTFHVEQPMNASRTE